ncbi:MAG: carbohydrate ABC transporter permease [Oscillospiraceae bacterium]|nr:carbohydrate ABC transporter permease [Oscillospiraceae bacterium]
MIKISDHKKATIVKKSRKIIYWLFFTMLFCGIGYILVYPLIYIFTTSVKSVGDMLDTTTVWVAKNPTFSNYTDVWNFIDYPASLLNTMTIAATVTILNMFVCSAIGYAFARFRFRERGILFALVIFTIIIPPQLINLPQYLFFLNFDILGIIKAVLGGTLNFNNSIAPIVLPAIFGQGLKTGLFIYIFRQFYRGMPIELEEAGYLDGCGAIRTYLRIMAPNATPAFITVGLLSFVWHWNEVFNQSQFLNESPTLSMRLVGIVGFITKSSQVTDLSYVTPTKYAGVALVILPLIIVYLIGQRFFVQSVERSGIVG